MFGKQINLSKFGNSASPPNKVNPFQEGQCLGWASVASTGVLVNSNAEYGVLSIVRNSTGNYSVTFSQPVASVGEVSENVSCALNGTSPTTINTSIALDGSSRPVVTVRTTSPSILLGLISFNNVDAAFRISIFGRPQ